MKTKKQRRPVNLKRTHRVMIRFDGPEIKRFKADVKSAGLSQAEYGRRKCLDVPIANITEPSDR